MKQLALLLLALSLAACGTTEPGINSPAPLLKFEPSLRVHQLWDVRPNSGRAGYEVNLQAAVTQSSIYTAAKDGHINAINRATGDKLWSIDLAQDISSGPVVNDSTLILGMGDATIVALNTRTGHKLWQQSVANEVVALPHVAQNKVYIKTIDGEVAALNLSDGKILWHYNHIVPSLVLRGGSEPAVSGRYVIVGFSDGKLDALEAKTGQLLWQRTIARPSGGTDIERMVDIDVDPVISQGIVYVATYQGKLAAVSMTTGELLWEHNLSAYTGLALTDDNLIITDTQGFVWNMMQNSGHVIWKQPQLKNRWLTAPVIMHDAIVVADAEGYVHWLSKQDGQIIARQLINSEGISASPIVMENVVYILTNDGELAALQVN